MKPTSVVSALVIASMGFSSIAHAQGWRDHDRAEDRRAERFEQRQERRAERFERRQEQRLAREHWRQRHGYAPHAYAVSPPVYRGYGYAAAPHAPRVMLPATPHHRGQVLPFEPRRHMYVVNDWHSHRLSAPPQGHQWMRSDAGEFLLVAVATGLIVNLMLNH